MYVKNFYAMLRALLKGGTGSFIKTSGATQSATNNYNSIALGNNYFQAASLFNPIFIHSTDTFNAANATNGTNNNYGSGVYFGNGTTPPTLDDYTFSGEILKNAGATSSVNIEEDDDGATYTAVYTISNTGDTDFTVSEVGLVWAYSTYRILFERTVLDTPVTIPAGGVGQVTYTIRFNYPTA